MLTHFTLIVDDPNAPLAMRMDESYTLEVNLTIASLRARTQWGTLRGLETFSQLADANCRIDGLPLTVSDAPRFTHRGLMIDTARDFWPLDALLDFVSAMEYSKLSVLHVHLTDSESFPCSSATFPKLTNAAFAPEHQCHPATRLASVGGSPCTYSHAQLRKLVAHAEDRGIRVIPEFDTPAHAASWAVGYPAMASVCTSAAPGWSSRLLLDPLSGGEAEYVVQGFLSEMAAVLCAAPARRTPVSTHPAGILCTPPALTTILTLQYHHCRHRFRLARQSPPSVPQPRRRPPPGNGRGPVALLQRKRSSAHCGAIRGQAAR